MLGARQVVVQAIHVGGGVLLARSLTPDRFGLYALVVLCGGVALTAGAAGLGAGLVRQPAPPDETDRRTAFTLQLLFVLPVAVAAWLTARWAGAAGWLGAEEVGLVGVVALALPLGALLLVPVALLERELTFDRLARVEIVQAAVFNVAAVVLTWAGVGPVAFGFALLLRLVAGVGLLAVVSPWRPRLGLHPVRARAQLRFALPLLGTVGLSLLRDGLTPALVGLVGGTAAVGFTTWAQTVAGAPSWVPMILQRTYLPALARHQADRRALGRLVERFLQVSHGVVAPLAVLTLVLVEPITRLVFGEQWLPALPLVRLLWVANLFSPTVTPLLGLLTAVGEPRRSLQMNALWLVGAWGLGLPLLRVAGLIGYGVANLLTQSANLLLFRVARERVPLRLLASAWPAWSWAAVVGVVVHGLARAWPPRGLATLLLLLASGAAIYLAGTALALGPRRLVGLRRLIGSPLALDPVDFDIPGGECDNPP